jgi:hypothetical protein
MIRDLSVIRSLPRYSGGGLGWGSGSEKAPTPALPRRTEGGRKKVVARTLRNHQNDTNNCASPPVLMKVSLLTEKSP